MSLKGRDHLHAEYRISSPFASEILDESVWIEEGPYGQTNISEVEWTVH